MLVATTVIEVGVDVPNASLMVIEHAERFGLAQLHQLRGRVGRGAAESTCVLLFEEPLTETAKVRLKVIYENTDGFEIARQDLLIRGPGEFLGARQSGVPLLRFADLERDVALIEQARDAADELLQQGSGGRRGASRALAGRPGGVHQGVTSARAASSRREVGACLTGIKALADAGQARTARMRGLRPAIADHVPLHPRPEPHDRAARRAGAGRVRAGRAGARAARPARARRRSRKRRSCRRATAPRSTSTAASRSRSRAGSRTSTACRRTSLAPYLYTLPRDKAVTHAFRVASGLDSMVLGEPQILGQMKQAVRTAEVGRLARPRAESPVPAHVRGGEGRAHADRHRQRVDLDGGGGGEARRAHLPVDLRAAAAADRRRRDDRARGDAFRRAQAEVDHRRQPHAGARRAARRRASAPRRSR